MSNLPQSDLILAGRFVDGDLPADETAQVEVRISKDADFAAAVEQIRNQSSLLGRLPRFTPSDDLADRTLQASMDQVKAIMGAWPIESAANEKTTLAPEAAEKPFDWKSTVALVASLAGVLMLGAMLWQNNFAGEENMAMNESPPMAVASVRSDETMSKKSSKAFEAADMEEENLEQAVVAGGMQKRAKSVTKDDSTFSKALTGTPMKRTLAPQQTQNTELALTNASSQVAQVWFVNQDSTASRSAVFDILNSIEIAVQREQTPPKTQTADAYEAFHVAATPKQMKLAISQISNNADIEMIEIPSSADSPITDAIQQQFTQSYSVPNFSANATPNENLPPKFQRSQAMGQQLFSNSLPRSVPGPVPPILKSGSQIAGLDNVSDPANLALESNAKMASPAPAANAGLGGMGGPGRNALVDKSLEADNVMAEATTNLQQRVQQKPMPPTSQIAELDKYLDDSEQLQQYLILVRGGEENK